MRRGTRQRDGERILSTAKQPTTSDRRRLIKKGRSCSQRFIKYSYAVLCAIIIVILISNTTSNLVPHRGAIGQHQLGTTTTFESRRFPKYGTNEFAQQCNWTLHQNKQDEPDCTLLVRPLPKGHEGIAQWISMAASGHIAAIQTGCRLLMDYGDAVDIHQVLTPVSTDWTIPADGFECSNANRCYNVSPFTLSPPNARQIGTRLGKKLVVVPTYRFAYINTPFLRYPTQYQELEQELPGFDLGTGMACSLGSLFDLAPSASQFEPDLFTRILPTLRDENALVMAIYIRTGHTDAAAKAEKDGSVAVESTSRYRRHAMPSLQCALNFEERYLSSESSEGAGFHFSRIVWVLMTDSADLKQWVVEEYGSQDANKRVSVERQKRKDQIIPREVVTTTSRGVQTRSSRNPSTADFAEALIDWYLIGESDLVVNDDYRRTYGATASLRTARPFHNAGNCSEPLPRFGPPRFQSALEADESRKAIKKPK